VGTGSAPAEAIGKVGEVLYLALDLHAALRALREALRRQRVYPWAWWRRSHVHWALGQRRAALRSLRMAVAQDPHSDVLLNELAGRYQELGQAERAVALLQASPLTPGSFDLRHRLVELLLECGRHEDALAAAESALREMGAPGRFGPLAASALVRLGRDEEARALLARLCEEAEADGDGLGLGSLAEEWLEHDAAEAVRWGRRAAELLGEDPSDQLAFAHLLLEAGDRDGAEEVLEQLARTSPSAPVFHALSQVAARRSDPDGQVAWLHRAVDAAASPEEVRRYADQLGDVLEERGQTAEITALMNRIEGRVDEAWRRTYLGYAAELTGEYSEAVAHYQAALAIDPLFRWAHFRLPLALLRLEQCDEAIRAAEATVSRWPGDAAMHWLLGRCLLQAGRRDEAASRFRSSLHLDPNAAQPRRGLWEALQMAALPSWRNSSQVCPLSRGPSPSGGSASGGGRKATWRAPWPRGRRPRQPTRPTPTPTSGWRRPHWKPATKRAPGTTGSRRSFGTPPFPTSSQTCWSGPTQQPPPRHSPPRWNVWATVAATCAPVCSTW
jgi:Tetratricopeptide repeat.